MIEPETFIKSYERVIPEDFCNKLIQKFELLEKINFESSFNNAAYGALGRQDKSYLLNYHEEFSSMVFQVLSKALQEYTSVYQQLAKSKLFPSEIKIQRTKPSEGFHVWHYESDDYLSAQRELAWIIYLNDLPDGEGETEFLYQRCRLKPTAGTIAIWPAAMTHVHRGNTVFTKDKYILTGWFIRVPHE